MALQPMSDGLIDFMLILFFVDGNFPD